MKPQEVSVGGIVLRRDKKFLVVRRAANEEFIPGEWDIPGGGAKYAEEPPLALQREIQEECGLKVTVRNPVAIGQYKMNDVLRTEIIYICTLDNEEQTVKLSSEHDACDWVSVQQIDSYGFDQYMKDNIQKGTADLDYWFSKYF